VGKTERPGFVRRQDPPRLVADAPSCQRGVSTGPESDPCHHIQLVGPVATAIDIPSHRDRSDSARERSPQ